jgi:hypothetical protein
MAQRLGRRATRAASPAAKLRRSPEGDAELQRKDHGRQGEGGGASRVGRRRARRPGRAASPAPRPPPPRACRHVPESRCSVQGSPWICAVWDRTGELAKHFFPCGRLVRGFVFDSAASRLRSRAAATFPVPSPRLRRRSHATTTSRSCILARPHREPASTADVCSELTISGSLFGWLVADGWCWFVLREEYCWLVAGGWFVLREKYCWLVADKPSEQGGFS